MFKFGFSVSDNEQDDEHETDMKEWFEAKEHFPANCKCTVDESSIQSFKHPGICLKYVSPNYVINQLAQSATQSNCILKAESDHSDLITAEYEGGLKIWECTVDLMSYLHETSVDFTNKRVLDLGCGAGILGLFALQQGAKVHFQDYNKEVIEYTTIPNVCLNISAGSDCVLHDCKFFSGDWASLTNVTTTQYDYILTSETIYNPENYAKLLDLFGALLAVGGTIYLAAKTYYFGVGGGIRQFEQAIGKRATLTSTVCWRTGDGVQREILCICRK